MKSTLDSTPNKIFLDDISISMNLCFYKECVATEVSHIFINVPYIISLILIEIDMEPFNKFSTLSKRACK